MKKLILLIVGLSLIGLVLIACGPAASPEPTVTPTPELHPGKAIVASRCIGCHELNRVTNARYDEQGWQLTVDRMVLSGAQLNEEQVATVVDYLAKTYPKE